MRTLAIDSATEACSVALFADGALLAGELRLLGRGHAEALVPMIAALPGRGKADRIVVSLGPGSFTGVRVGIAAAKALALAWGAELLGYPTLSLVAAMAQAGGAGPLTVCMNGGHGEWFVQNFGVGGEAETAVASLPLEAAAKHGSKSDIAGNRAAELASLLGVARFKSHVILPDARSVQLLPEAALIAEVSPIYGRAPDARLPAGLAS
jgi:tRNA threonylcarbamoyladenosine biosynthesis protein TsaB